MQRRTFLLGSTVSALLTLAGAGPSRAQSLSDRVTRALRRDGYRDISVQRTLLGRLRVTGHRNARTREIILNSRTGEILRDLVRSESGEVSSVYAEADNDDDQDASDDTNDKDKSDGKNDHGNDSDHGHDGDDGGDSGGTDSDGTDD